MLSPGYNIINSEDYVITDIQKSGKLLGQTYFNGFNLTLRACDADNELGQVFIISKNESITKFKKLATELEAIRMTAVQTKNKKSANMYWRSYFKLMESFLTPYDLIYEDRIVRKKSIDYGYCISVHKSQGSSLDNVLIDMSNILLCRNKEDLRQLQYVAMSRTKNNIVILN